MILEEQEFHLFFKPKNLKLNVGGMRVYMTHDDIKHLESARASFRFMSGSMRQIEYYDINGRIINSSEYDKKGNKVKYSISEDRSQIFDIIYENRNTYKKKLITDILTLKRTKYLFNGVAFKEEVSNFEKTFFKYDFSGRPTMIETLVFDENEFKKKNKKIYVYDKPLITKIISHSIDEDKSDYSAISLDNEVELIYDNEGKLIEKKTHRNPIFYTSETEMDRASRRILYKYDKSNKIVNKIEVNHGTQVSTHKYLYKANLLSRIDVLTGYGDVLFNEFTYHL